MPISDLFSDEKVNTGRQVELDIAKAFAIIFMVFLHTIMVVKAYSPGLSPAYDFIFGNVLGRPYAAVIFMFCMGVGVVYSRHSQWGTMVKRGVTLYLSGILVNSTGLFSQLQGIFGDNTSSEPRIKGNSLNFGLF